MTDTTPAAHKLVVEALRRQPPAERLRAMFALSESMRTLALDHLRALHPERSTLELVELLTGESLLPATRAGPVVPR